MRNFMLHVVSQNKSWKRYGGKKINVFRHLIAKRFNPSKIAIQEMSKESLQAEGKQNQMEIQIHTRE